MRISRSLAILSLTTALSTALGSALLISSPAHAAFEFVNKARPAEARPAQTATVAKAPATPIAPVSVPVVKTDSDEITAGDMAKTPSVPVWTAKSEAMPVAKPIPLTPIVNRSDALEVMDGPLLPNDSVATNGSLKPVTVPTTWDAPAKLPPMAARREVLARSSGMTDNDPSLKTNALAPAPAARDAVLWDNAQKPDTSQTMMSGLADMTTERAPTVKAATVTQTSTEIVSTKSSGAKATDIKTSDVKTSEMKSSDMASTHLPAPMDLAPIDRVPPPAMAEPLPAPAPIIETTIEPAPIMAPADDKVIEGFGKGMPMVLALRQIVPPTYRFSFDPAVNPGQRVSWQGGKPWSQIVTDIAASQGLKAEIAGNVVAIRGSNTGPSANNVMSDVVLGNTAPAMAPALVMAPTSAMAPVMPSKPAAKSMAPAPIKSLPAPAPMPPIAKIDAAPMNLTAAPAPTEPVLNRSIEVSDNTMITSSETTVANKSVLPKPLPPIEDEAAPDAEAKKMKPPVIVPLQDKLQDTKDIQAIATSKPDQAATSDLTASHEWVAHSGQSLRAILQDWSKTANVALVWSSDYDYPLQTDIRIQGNYPDAVRTLLAGFGKAQPKPIGRLHNNAGVGAQPVLIVDTPRLIHE